MPIPDFHHKKLFWKKSSLTLQKKATYFSEPNINLRFNIFYPFKDGLPCFVEKGKSDCLGSGKGRTLDKRFNKEVTKGLHALYQPFDDYFAKKVLRRHAFPWNFGIEDLRK